MGRENWDFDKFTESHTSVCLIYYPASTPDSKKCSRDMKIPNIVSKTFTSPPIILKIFQTEMFDPQWIGTAILCRSPSGRLLPPVSKRGLSRSHQISNHLTSNVLFIFKWIYKTSILIEKPNFILRFMLVYDIHSWVQFLQADFNILDFWPVHTACIWIWRTKRIDAASDDGFVLKNMYEN